MIKSSLFLVCILLTATNSFSQITLAQLGGNDTSTINTAIPFLIISPDARAGGMGDVGVATSADANAMHWNASKLGFSDKKFGTSFSYVPWLRALNITDVSLTYLSGFYKINGRNIIATYIKYFSIKSLALATGPGYWSGRNHTQEYNIGLSYINRLSRKFSMSATCGANSANR